MKAGAASRSGRRAIGALLGAGLAAAADGAAQAPESGGGPGQGTLVERCEGAEFREFDFWIGSWEVHSPDGELIGRNEIRRIGAGCGLLESWRGAAGGSGTSVNAYEAERGRWTQRWVGSGANLWLEGGLEGGPDGSRMILVGTRPRTTTRGEVVDRLTWEPLADGRVRQTWELSPDGGDSWERVFQGLYSRVSGGEEPVWRRPAELEWRLGPTGASFATLYGDPAEDGPFAFRMRMPPGFEMQPHFHDSVENVTVLSGTLHIRFTAEGEPIVLPAGSALSIPAGRPMWGWVEDEETVIQVHGTGPFRTVPLSGAGGGPAAGRRKR